jgi:hypothetical protein
LKFWPTLGASRLPLTIDESLPEARVVVRVEDLAA